MKYLDINAKSQMYVSTGVDTSGPYGANEIFALIGSGEIKPTDEIWIADTETTFPASELLPPSCFANASTSYSKNVSSYKRPASTDTPVAGALLGAGCLLYAIPVIAPFFIVALLLLLYGLKLN